MATYTGAIAKRKIADAIWAHLAYIGNLEAELQDKFGHKVGISRRDNLNILIRIGAGSAEAPRYINIKITEIL